MLSLGDNMKNVDNLLKNSMKSRKWGSLNLKEREQLGLVILLKHY